jgi:cell division protein FtsI (penicillin-binding protein 3)
MEKKSQKNIIRFRFALVYSGMVVIGMLILGRIVHLQFFKYKELKLKEISYTRKESYPEAKRGDICSRDGRLLACSIPYYDLRFDGGNEYIDDKEFRLKLDSIAGGLEQIFHEKTKSEYKYILQTARNGNRRYVLLYKNASYNQLKKVKALPIFNLGKNKGGLIVEQNNKRIMPYSNLASRTIGYMSETETGDITGTVGLEKAYDKELRGVKGYQKLQKLSGDVWMPVNDGSQVEPKDGLTIVSTLNIDVQDVAQTALKAAVDSNGANHGCAILMEVATGEVLAIANVGRNKDGVSMAENLNYAICEATEPGSTFKVASLIVGMEDGYIEPTDTVDTENGTCMFYNAKMVDSHHGGGRMSVQHALEVSSNVGISKTIVKYYRGKEKDFVRGLYNLRLNVPLGLEISGEGRPKIKDPDDSTWSGVSLPWMSIGYEVNISPMQTLTLYNAIANNGKMVKPHFVKEIRDKDRVLEEKGTEVLQPSICSKETLAKIRKMLKAVVDTGTASNIKNKIYSIAGKTGTCVMNYWQKTEAKKYQASFVGYFPADKPKYSCIVVIYNPTRGSYYGNVVAGSVFKEIADKIYSTTLDIQPDVKEKFRLIPRDFPVSIEGYRDDLKKIYASLGAKISDKSTDSDWATTAKTDGKTVMSSKEFSPKQVPDVTGMGARDATYILENKGLRVIVQGKGIVKRQSIPAGSDSVKGKVIVLNLG